MSTAADARLMRIVGPQLEDYGCDLRGEIQCSNGVYLVLKANLDLLLKGRNNVVLCGSLEVGKLLHSRLDDFKGLLDLFLGDHERGSKTDDVLVGGLGLEMKSDTAKILESSNQIRTSKPFSFISMQRSHAE